MARPDPDWRKVNAHLCEAYKEARKCSWVDRITYALIVLGSFLTIMVILAIATGYNR
jgi:preprotein translocase subunit SecE